MNNEPLGNGDWTYKMCKSGVPTIFEIIVNRDRIASVEVFDPPGGMVDGVHYDVSVDAQQFARRSGKDQIYRLALTAGIHTVSVTTDRDSNIGVECVLPSTR